MKGVIFDFDGTLVSLSIDFKKIKERILKEAEKYKLKLSEKSLPILEFLDEVKRLNGRKGRDFYFTAHRILKEEELLAAERTYPGKVTLNLLRKLKRKEIKIGIITRNCREAVEGVIKRFNIPYDVLLTRDDVKKVKPDVSHIKMCLKLLGLQKEDVILVGDHIFDVKAGKNAGITSAGLKNGNIPEDVFIKEGADFVLEDLNELEYIAGIRKFGAGKLPNRFLRYLLKRYTTEDKDVMIKPGVGIDCTVFKVKDRVIFAKSDPITLTSKDIGFYLVNININDICVMGGIPTHLLTVLLFPEGISFPEIEYVFSQISDECKKFGINWIGGHTEISGGVKSPVAAGLLIGKRIRGLKKRKIKKGDVLFLVKEIGIEGASIIAREKEEKLKKYFSEKYIQRVKNSIRKPGINVFNEAKILWENFNIKYIHDPTEGGISTALYEVAEANNIGLLIYPAQLKFYPPVLKFCRLFNLDPLGIISSGCIIGITEKKEAERLIAFCKKRKIKGKIIGEVVDEKGVWYIKKGVKTQFPTFQKDEITRLYK